LGPFNATPNEIAMYIPDREWRSCCLWSNNDRSQYPSDLL